MALPLCTPGKGMDLRRVEYLDSTRTGSATVAHSIPPSRRRMCVCCFGNAKEPPNRVAPSFTYTSTETRNQC